MANSQDREKVQVFTAAVKRLRPRVRSWLCRGRVSRQELEDAEQRVWLKVWGAWTRLAGLPNGDLARYVRTVTSRIAWEASMEERHARPPEAWTAGDGRFSVADPPIEELQTASEALASVGETAREAYLASAVEGLSRREVAKSMGISLRRVGLLLRQARSRLAALRGSPAARPRQEKHRAASDFRSKFRAPPVN